MSRRKNIKRGPVPMHKQLAADIARHIANGNVKRDDALPTEATLGRQYHVSRETVRKAKELLRERGIVVAFRGRGTFVTGTRAAAQRAHAELSKIN